jgi:GAF domain-containing protein
VIRPALQRAAVRRITQCITQRAQVRDLNQAIVEEAVRLTNSTSAALCLLVESGDQLEFVAVQGENAGEILGLRIRVADSVSESVLASGIPILIDSNEFAPTDDLFAATEHDAAHRRTDPMCSTSAVNRAVRSAAVVPLFDNGRTIGTIVAQNKGSENNTVLFDQEDLDILAMLAGFYGIGYEVERSAIVACEQSRELAVLYDAAQTVAANLNVQQVLDNVLTALCTHLEYHSAVLFLLNDERTHLFIAAERGLSEDESEVQLSVETGPHAQTLITGQAQLISDTDAMDGFLDISERVRALSAMIAPIKSRNEIHGILQVTSLQRHAYRAGDLKLVSAVGMQAGIAIENAWLYEDAQRQAEQSGALYDLSQHVNATLNLDRVLDFVAESVVNLLNVDKFALLLVDPKSGRLVARLSRGIDSDDFAHYQPGLGEGIAGWVYEWQTPQAVANIAADPRDRTASLDRFGVASVLCVPMHVGDEVIGILMGMTSRRRLFTVGEMELLYTISNQAAVAIYNALQYRLARTRSHEMSRYFRRIAHALGSSFDGNLPQVISDLAIEIMRADRCTIYRLDGDQLHLCASSRFRTTAPPEQDVPIGLGLAGWVARRGQSLVLLNLFEDSRWQAHASLQREHLTSYLGVPLKAGRRTVGVIEIYSQQPREFTREEVQLLSTFARRARVAERMAEGL